MAEIAFKELDARWNYTKSRRGPHEQVWQEIVDVCMPFRGDISTKKSPGSRRIGPILDNTASLSASAFTNFLKGAITPAQTDWMRLHAPEPFEEDLQARRDLDATSRRVLRALADSNFYVQWPLTLRDDAVLGNGTLLTEELPARETKRGARFRGLVFNSIPIARAWWTQGKDGRPDMVICLYTMPAINAADYLGPDSPVQLHAAAVRDPMGEVDLVHFVHKNYDYDENDPFDWQWYSCWGYYEGQGGIKARSGGYEYNPYSVFRWMQVDGEEYGRGQGHYARPNARGVNEMMRKVHIAADRDTLPPLMMEDPGNVDFDISPNGVMVIRPPVKMEPKFLMSGSNYQVAYDILDADRKHIRESFYMQFLDNPDTQPRSREESVQRLTRGLQQMASPAEVLQGDLGHVVENVITIMHAGGALPEFDSYLKRVGPDYTAAEVVFTSPFFAAQKHGSLERVRDFIAESLAYWKETGDESWKDDLDPSAITKFRSLMADVPADIFNDPAKVNARRTARARRDAQRRGIEMAQAAMGSSRSGRGNAVTESIPQGSSAATTPDLEALP